MTESSDIGSHLGNINMACFLRYGSPMRRVFMSLGAVIIFIQMVSAEVVSLGRYCRGLRVPDSREDWMSTRKYHDTHLYQEPLYADADPSTPVYPAKEIAIIGEYSGQIRRCKWSARKKILDTDISKEVG